jgi:NAD(P)H-flavin reductase
MAPYATAVTIAAIAAAGGCILFKTMGPSRLAFGFPSYRLTPVQLVESKGLTHDVNHYKFRLPSPDSPAAPVGSAMLIKTAAGIRPFTPVYNNSDPGYVHFAIKNYHRGVSKSLADLEIGDEVKIAGPIPYIEVTSSSANYDQVYLIGAGNGITPLWSYLTDTLNDPMSETKLKLIYANKSKDDIVFMDEINRLKAQYPGRFEIVHVLEKASEVAQYTGRLTDEILKKEISTVGSDNQILVCGPPMFIETVAGAKPAGPPFVQGTLGGTLKEIGFKQNQVVKY